MCSCKLFSGALFVEFAALRARISLPDSILPCLCRFNVVKDVLRRRKSGVRARAPEERGNELTRKRSPAC